MDTGELYAVTPEYATQSRRPGIGYTWFEKYKGDCRKDFIQVNGTKIKPPKYYDQFRELDDPDHMEVVKLNRAEHARINNEGLLRNYTKEEIKERQLNKLMRTL